MLDVLAGDADGARYNVEMQLRSHPDWNERSAYYLARTFANCLRSGQDYGQLRAAIGIYLMGFQRFDDPSQAHWCFEIRERKQP